MQEEALCDRPFIILLQAKLSDRRLLNPARSRTNALTLCTEFIPIEFGL